MNKPTDPTSATDPSAPTILLDSFGGSVTGFGKFEARVATLEERLGALLDISLAALASAVAADVQSQVAVERAFGARELHLQPMLGAAISNVRSSLTTTTTRDEFDRLMGSSSAGISDKVVSLLVSMQKPASDS